MSDQRNLPRPDYTDEPHINHNVNAQPDPKLQAAAFFRSELMSMVQLYIPTDLAQPTVSDLGELGVLEFKDLNGETTVFQRTFVNEIRRLDDMERKIRYLTSNVQKEQIPLRVVDSIASTAPRTAQEIDDLDETIEMRNGRIFQMNENYSALLANQADLIELREVLDKTADVFHEKNYEDELAPPSDASASSAVSNDPLIEQPDLEAGRPMQSSTLDFVAGVIPRSRVPVFERILWRALRGNLFLHTAEIGFPIVDVATESSVEKNVLVICAHGQELMSKIRKISESLGAKIYPVSSDAKKRRETGSMVNSRLEDLQNVIRNSKEARIAELRSISESIMSWNSTVLKEKAIYQTMNLFNFDPARKCLIAEAWCPTDSIPEITRSLRHVQKRAGSPVPSLLHVVPTHEEPPTYHRTNKFSQGFQAIVDAYGMARYREVNPGLFTVISFPFLFAVMFGDLGHGLIMTLFAAYLVIKEKALENKDFGEIFAMMYSGRYIILLMGLFSMYTGLIYNDIFSKALYLAPSMYVYQNGNGEAVRVDGYTYPFGVDPLWHLAENNLLFGNSYKMKMAILFGVLQMSFGIILTVVNHLHFRRASLILAEFVPQILFMMSIFGYLCVTILMKWSTDYRTSATGPPSLLNMLIYMFLSPGSVNKEDQLYPNQGLVQLVLVLLAVVCIPWMLLAKPLILRSEIKAREAAGFTNHGVDSEITATEVHEDEEHGHENFGDLMIHQGIHTIEFCLGCISNTASYLRLWALSLAHAQLSEVLWDMLFTKMALNKDTSGVVQVIMIFALSFFWLILTISILLIMEGLSAFLHALRLHWVEFNNKFYEGTGRKFMPFSFVTVFHPEAE